MKLNKDTKKYLSIGDVLLIDDNKYLVTNLLPSGRYGNGLNATIQNMETKQTIYLTPVSSLYGSEILQTMEGWQYRMKTLKADIEKMDKAITDDHNRWSESLDGIEMEMEDFQISYRGQTIRIPTDLAGFLNPIWELFEGIKEGAEEQID